MENMQALSSLPAGPPSVLAGLNRLSRRLERSLMTLGAEAGADCELRDIAAGVVSAACRHPEVALASIFLNQIGGLYAVRHCVESAIVATLVARPSRDMFTVAAAALTMNAGMVRLTEVFQLKDCALSADERAAVRRHPEEGAELLRRAGVADEAWLTCVLMHHEADDGSGYPGGLRGGGIPENARLVGMADRYCALVSARNYRRSILPPAALERLCGARADAGLAARFRARLGTHPPGTLVRLRSGESGVVSTRRDRAGFVTVHALRGANGAQHVPPQARSTRNPVNAIDSALHEDEAGLRFSMRQVWGDIARV